MVKPKQGLIAGLIFGIFMGVFYSFMIMSHWGLVRGLISGLLFGLLMLLFANSGFVKRQTEINQEKLIGVEKIITSELANLVIKPKDFKLKSFAFDSLLWTVGMKNKESLGGKLHITNYRLIFKSHKLNRVRGDFSIFLPTIKATRDFSLLFMKKIILETYSSKIEIVIDKPKELCKLIDDLKKDLSQQTIKHIQTQITQNPGKCSDSLKQWKAINIVNNLFLIGNKGNVVSKFVRSPIEALSSIFLKEFLDKTIVDEWQKKFN